MKGNKPRTNYLKILINGILMGTANKIPGVSGGLVAIAIGFYEELIYSLKRLDKIALKYLFKGKFKDFFTHVNGKFLVLISLGIVISYFSTSKILDVLLNNFEIYVWSLFFGLVVGTIFHLRTIIDLKNFKNIFRVSHTSKIFFQNVQNSKIIFLGNPKIIVLKSILQNIGLQLFSVLQAPHICRDIHSFHFHFESIHF